MQTYIGERYTPLHRGEWNVNINDYGFMHVVYANGKSYTALKPVPQGTPVTNTDYWVVSADFNEQLAILQDKVDSFNLSNNTKINGIENVIKDLQQHDQTHDTAITENDVSIENNRNAIEELKNTVKNYTDDINNKMSTLNTVKNDLSSLQTRHDNDIQSVQDDVTSKLNDMSTKVTSSCDDTKNYVDSKLSDLSSNVGNSLKELNTSASLEGSWCVNKKFSNGTDYTVIFIPKEFPLKMGLNLENGKVVGCTVKDFAKKNKLPICINAGRCFDNADGTQYFTEPTVYGGKVYQDTNTSNKANGHTWSIGIKDGTFKWFNDTYTGTQILNAGYDYALGGFNPFIENGAYISDLNDKTKYFANLIDSPYPRQVIARDIYGNHIIFTCDGKYVGHMGMTYQEVATILINEYNVNTAYMLDGGGSVATVYDGVKQTYDIDSNRTEPRKMANFLYFENNNKSIINDSIILNNLKNEDKAEEKDKLFDNYHIIYGFNNLLLDFSEFVVNNASNNLKTLYHSLPSLCKLTAWITTESNHKNLHDSIIHQIANDTEITISSSTAFELQITKNLDSNISNQVIVIPNDSAEIFYSNFDSGVLKFSELTGRRKFANLQTQITNLKAEVDALKRTSTGV